MLLPLPTLQLLCWCNRLTLLGGMQQRLEHLLLAVAVTAVLVSDVDGLGSSQAQCLGTSQGTCRAAVYVITHELHTSSHVS